LQWYLGPVMHHYRYYKVWVWTSNKECITDTRDWFLTNTIIPFKSSIDAANALRHISPFAVITHLPHYFDPTWATSTTCRYLLSAHAISSQWYTILSPRSSTRLTCVTTYSLANTFMDDSISESDTEHRAKHPPHLCRIPGWRTVHHQAALRCLPLILQLKHHPSP
jgi:hypothetical protein